MEDNIGDKGNDTMDGSSSHHPGQQRKSTAAHVVDTTSTWSSAVESDSDAFYTPARPKDDDNDTIVSQTPELMEKFKALSDQWSVTSSSVGRQRHRHSQNEYRETVSLMSKLEDLEHRWKTSPSQHEVYSAGSYDSSSLGQTTLSSRDDGDIHVSVFERLYRNERKYRRRRTSANPSLERRRMYSDRVRTGWNHSHSKVKNNSTAVSSTSGSVAADSVFERLYRQTPQHRSGASSVRSAPTVVRSTRLVAPRRGRRPSPLKKRVGPIQNRSPTPKRLSPSIASSTSPTSPMSGSDHRMMVEITTSAAVLPTTASSPASPPRISHRGEDTSFAYITRPPRTQSSSPEEPKRVIVVKKRSQTSYGTKRQDKQQESEQVKLLEQAAAANKARRLWIREQQTTTAAAVQVQKLYRGFQQRRRCRRRATMVLQRFTRQYVLHRHRCITTTTASSPSQQQRPSPRHPSSPEDTCARAVYRQAVWCAPHVQRLLTNYLSGRALLITTTHKKLPRLQALARGVLIRTRYRRLLAATGTIQSTWRRYCAARRIQRVWRVYFRRLVASWLVQRWWRMQWRRIQYQQGRRACAVLQRFVRRRQRDAAIVRLQSVVRRELAQRCVLEQFQAALLLQYWWRTIRIVQQYQSSADAIIRVQSVFRRWIVQRQIVETWSAALVVQGWWRIKSRSLRSPQAVSTVPLVRRHDAQKLVCLDELEPAVLVVQRSARRFLTLRREAMHREEQLCAAARIQAWRRLCQSVRHEEQYSVVVLQAWMRQHCDRYEYRRRRQSVILLQSFVRQYCIRKPYGDRQLEKQLRLQTDMAARRIQRCWHNFGVSKVQVAAAQHIQAAWRTRQCRGLFLKSRSSCVVVQSLGRLSLAKNITQQRRLEVRELHCTKAATRLQRWIRMCQATDRFRETLHAAVTLQKRTRGAWARRDFYRNQTLIRKQQAYCRRFLSQQRLRKLRAIKTNEGAAIQIQGWWRLLSAAARWEKQQLACVLLQTHARTWLARHVIQRRRRVQQQRASSAVFLQTWARSRQAMLEYERKLHAVVHLQKWARQRGSQRLYEGVLVSTVLLQRSLRRCIVQRRMAQRGRSASLIQSLWRSHLDDRLYYAACTIQAQSRMVVCRGLLRRKRRSCVKVQALVRKTLAKTVAEQARVAEKRRHDHAVVIQRCLRMHQAQYSYMSVCKAMTLIQALTRGFLDRQSYKTKKSQIRLLQTCCRRFVAQIRVARHLAMTEKESYAAAVTCLQCWSRLRHAVNTSNNRRLAVQVLQTSARCWLARRVTCRRRSNLEQDQKASAVVLQSWYRGVQSRTEYATRYGTILLLQGYMRGRMARRRYLHHLCAVAVLQRLFRNVHIQKKSALRDQCARRIQQSWRTHHHNRLLCAARKIQAFLRMTHCCGVFNTKRRSCVAIQTILRQILTQNRLQLQLKVVRRLHQDSVTAMQRYFRMHQARLVFLTVRSAILHLQRITRGFVTRCSYNRQLLHIRQLQSFCRRFLKQRRTIANAVAAQRRQRDVAATGVQRWWRQRCAIDGWQKHRVSCLVIQNSFRLWLTRQENLQLRHSSTLVVQSWARKHQAMCVFRRKYSSVVYIQKSIRRCLAYANYSNSVKNVVVLQRWFRCQHLRRRFARWRNSTMTLQKQWRKHRHAEQRDSAARTIQSFGKVSQHRSQFLRSQHAILKIEAAARVNFAKNARLLLERNNRSAAKLQSWARMNSIRNTFTSTIRAAVTLQSCARGFLSRLYFRRVFMLAQLLQCHVHYFLKRRRLEQSTATLLKVRRAVAVSCLVRWWRVQRAAQLLSRQQVACVMLQTRSRSYLARRQLRSLQQLRSNAVVLQSWWRMLQAKMTVHALNRSIVLLQKYIRRVIANHTITQKREETHRRSEHVAVHRIQILWRTAIRNRIKCSAAVAIQSHYRMVHYYRLFQVRRRHCITIQSFALQCLAARSSKNGDIVKKTMEKRSATVLTIQSWIMMNRSKSDFQVVVSAVVKFQAAVRRFSVRKCFKEKLRIVLRIQANYHNRKDLQQSTAQCLTDQLAAESPTFAKLSDAVVMIQSIWRGRRSKFMLECMRKRHFGAVAIQSTVRSFQRRRKLAGVSEAAVVIQSVWRQHTASNNLRLQNDKARCLQCFWRGHKARIKLDAVVSYQHDHRSISCRQQRHEQVCATVKRIIASTRIQRVWRKDKVMQRAATRIQALVRLSRQGRRFRLMRQELIRIQCFVRFYQAQSCYKNAKASSLLPYTAAESMQRSFRGHAGQKVISVRKKNKLDFAATSIMTCWRAKRDREKFNTKVAAVVLIQAQCRAFIARKSLSNSVTCCAMIQALSRGVSTRKKIAAVRFQQKADEGLLQNILKATPLQATQRSFRDRIKSENVELDSLAQQADFMAAGTQTLSVHDACCRIQSRWRGARCCGVSREAMRDGEYGYSKGSDSSIACAAAQLLQKNVKGYLARLAFLKQQRSAVVIQSHWRSLVQQRELDELSQMPSRVPACVLAMQREDSSFRIQKWWRRQRHVSSYGIPQRLRELQNSERTVTHPYAQTVSFGSATRQWPLQSNQSDQARIQESLARQIVVDQRRAATTIQSFWRTAWEQRKLEDLSIRLSNVSRFVVVLRREDKAIRLQKWWRRWRIQSSYLARRRQAAHCLQLLYGSWKMKRDVSRFQTAVDLLQRGLFGSLSRTMACYGVLQANTVVACHRARPCMASHQKAWLELRAQLRQLAATLLQAVYRGYRSRLRTSIGARLFWPAMLSRRILHHEPTPTTAVSARHSPTNVVCGDAYRARVEQKALDVVVAYAAAEAELVVIRHRPTFGEQYNFTDTQDLTNKGPKYDPSTNRQSSASQRLSPMRFHSSDETESNVQRRRN